MTGKVTVIYQIRHSMAIKTIGIDIRDALEGGAGKSRYVLELTRALIKRAPKDFQFHLFTKNPNPHFPSTAHVHQIIISGRGLSWHLALRNYLRHHPVDFFLAPTSFIFPALALKGQKVAIVVHDLIAFLHSKAHAWFPTVVERLTLRKALRKASMVICVSEHTAKDLARLFPEAHKKPVLIAPPAVSKTVRFVNSQKMDLPAEFLLGVGTLSPRKNFGLLFDALPLLLPKHPNLHIVIAGGEGWQTSGIYKKIPYHLRERIRFLGHVSADELNELYSRAAMLVFPSLYEGFGIPPLEAMACGCPVIVSHSASLPEVVGDAALQVDPKNPKALADAVELLLGPKVRDNYIKRGYKRIQHFSWDESAERILSSWIRYR